MSPLKIHHSDVTRGVINGPRPLPLRISRESHVIHKPPPPPPPSAAGKQSPAAAKRQPVIIYTHSPKVIHTKPNEFMKIVQKLTGMSRGGGGGDDDGDSAGDLPAAAPPGSPEEEADDGNDPTTDDHLPAAAAPMYKMPGAFLVEAPLFTPSSSEFFCSPRPNGMFGGAAISPSFMDYMKGYPEF